MSRYSVAVLADTPSGYWRLGDIGASILDSSGNGSTGSTVNSPRQNVAGLLGRDPDGAIRLAAAQTQYVNVPANANLDLGDVFTLEAWVRLNSIGITQSIIGKGTNAYLLRLRFDNNFVELLKDGVSSIVSSTVAITDTTLVHHIVATKNGATVHLYIDGQDVTGVVTNATLANTATAMMIGVDPAGMAQYMDATVDEVAIYKTALSAARVRAHYIAGAASMYSDLVMASAPAGYWRLDERFGATVIDWSGNDKIGSYTAPYTQGMDSLLPIDPGAALAIAAGGGAVTIPGVGGLPSGRVSVECWLALPGTGFGLSGSNPVERAAHTANGWYFDMTLTGDIDFTIGTTACDWPSGGYLPNIWHLVATYDGLTIRLYVNGILRQTAALLAATLDTTSNIHLFGPAGNIDSYVLDEVAVYPTVLSARDVLAHFQGGWTAPYAVKVDLQNLGSLDDPLASCAQGLGASDADRLLAADLAGDVTRDWRTDAGVAMSRGKDATRILLPPKAGAASFMLSNQLGLYSPGEQLQRGQRMRVETVADDGTRTPLFSGLVDYPAQDPRLGRQQVSVPCLGTLSRLAGMPMISTPVYQFITTDQAISFILDAVGWPQQERLLDTGSVTLRWWWLQDGDPWQALTQLVITEGPGSTVYEDTKGRVVFKRRRARMEDANSVTSQATIQGMLPEPAYTAITYDEGMKDVINSVRLQINVRETGTWGVVWQYGKDITLAPNETVKILARPTDPWTGGDHLNAPADYTVPEGSLIAPPSLDPPGGWRTTVTISMTAGASGAIVSGLQFNGYNFPVQSTSQITSSIDTSASIGRYGLRPYSASIWPELDAETAQALADDIIWWYQNGRPTVDITLLSNGAGNNRTQQITRDIGDRITIVEQNLPLNADAWIEAIQHRIRPGGILETTFKTEIPPPGQGWGPYAPTTVVDDATVGTVAWSNPANAAGPPDLLYASAAAGAGAVTSHYLKGTMGASGRIPNNARLQGVKVRVLAQTNFSSGYLTAGPSPATVATQYARPLTSPWTNPNNILLNDANYASIAFSNQNGWGSYWLAGTGLGFALPSTAQVLGIGWSVTAYYTGSPRPDFLGALIMNGNVIPGTGAYIDIPSGAPGVVSPGGLGWWASTPVSTINSPNFGLACLTFPISNDAVTVFYGYMTMTVFYYSAPLVDNCRLVAGGTILSQTRSSNMFVGGAPVWLTYGGPTDLWGLDPVAGVAQVNGVNFGAAVSYQLQANQTMNVDAMRIYTYWQQ